jgi:beta-mannosidase
MGRVNDCLSLPFRLSAGGVRALGGWEGCWCPLGEGEAAGLPLGRGGGWEPVPVPFQQSATEGRSAIWYRTRFPRPDHDGRVLLRVGGAFLATHVWLNGRILGSHYGYFCPFGFDVTSRLRSENLLVICCESPIETDLARKRHVMGIFNDGDNRPYPGSAWFGLPEGYRWEVPVGLWRPVELEYVGPVTLDWVRLRPRLDAGDAGRLDVEVRLRNLDGREMAGDVVVEVTGPELPPLRLRRRYRVAGGGEQTNLMTLGVPHARRWQPWRAGEPVLYRCVTTVTANGRESARVDDRFGFRDAVVQAGHEGWQVAVNGQPMFLRGANYVPGLRLDQLTEATFKSDLRLARECNLDLLRIHGHVLPDEFYRLADEVGMLVVADFPLTLSYAYHATAEESRFFETSVRAQVPEMVELLRNRPSVLCWVAHDDPPWVPGSAELGDVHAVRQNYTVDHEIKALIERLDPTRTVLAASGEFDQHLWLGWREGSWSDYARVRPTLVSEFGAQAAPSLGSPAWAALNRTWPLRCDDPQWLYSGFQLAAWAEHGAGLPEEHESLEEFVAAGQEYQGQLLGFAIDRFRLRKFAPCWGAFVYQLCDPFPGVGFGLVDSARVPRPALEVVREAFAPVRVIVDALDFTPLEPCGAGWRPGEPVGLRLAVVNDDPHLTGPAEVRWAVWRERALERGGLAWLRDAIRRKSYSGSVGLDLPGAGEAALQVTDLNLALDAEGDYVLEAELRIPGREPVRTAFGFLIAEELPTGRRRPLLPPYLAERIVLRDSLRPDPEGLRFRIRNRTRPAVLTRIGDLRVDGQPVEGRLLVHTESGRLPLPRRLDLPVDRELELLLELTEPVEARPHVLELDLTLPGVASGRVRISGRPDPHPQGP